MKKQIGGRGGKRGPLPRSEILWVEVPGSRVPKSGPAEKNFRVAGGSRVVPKIGPAKKKTIYIRSGRKMESSLKRSLSDLFGGRVYP